MRIIAGVARESILILDSDLRVIVANPTFYQNFLVLKKQTENMNIYELGNGEWNIPILKKMLKDILSQNKVVKNFEVSHIFEKIGKKTFLLNARQIDTVQLIIIAMEDITERKNLEERLSEYTERLEVKVSECTEQLVARIKDLEELNATMVGRELKMVELGNVPIW